ncbi:response regulator transcription factor [Actinacidiphila sp. ITFR-21]|uniref:response regulator transcription factor n=1 Tax=Actinacidiphila sp. ITFR-21 TaxID=3075199 RepID=UPI0028890B82|nr:response regulator transcription factor [Streptomyces sp. ITFR-21]WNI16726.1 response regulator transcription factor [Streptomyces sp. ITFR-21]
MREEGNIRVFLLDDHEVVRRGFRELLLAEPGVEIVGEAADAAEAMTAVQDARPDVALLDVRLPDGSGVEVCREIRSRDPAVKCLMLTSFTDDEAVFDAVMAGASGYVLKVISGGDLVRAVKEVAAGESLLEPGAGATVLARLRGGGNRTASDPDHDPGDLTEQELRILDLIGDGLTDRQIGQRTRLAEKTVRKHVSSLLAKLGMTRHPHAAAYGARARPTGGAAGSDDGGP